MLRTGGKDAIGAVPVSRRDCPSPRLDWILPPWDLLLGQMRGRTLPVAPARFAQQLQATLAAMAGAAA